MLHAILPPAPIFTYFYFVDPSSSFTWSGRDQGAFDLIFGGNVATGLPELSKPFRTSKNLKQPKFRDLNFENQYFHIFQCFSFLFFWGGTSNPTAGRVTGRLAAEQPSSCEVTALAGKAWDDAVKVGAWLCTGGRAKPLVGLTPRST